MIPLNTKCYVKNRGIGVVEAICNDKPNVGVSFSYCVRLKKNPLNLHWFGWDEVTAYDGPDEDQNNKERKPREVKEVRERAHQHQD